MGVWQQHENWLSARTKLLGALSRVGKIDSSCATGGGSRSGGVLVPLGTAVPWGDSPRAQGGPESSETLFVWFLFVFSGLDVWVFCVVLLVSGLGFLFGLVPFRT